jgi:hypothetical protein
VFQDLSISLGRIAPDPWMCDRGVGPEVPFWEDWPDEEQQTRLRPPSKLREEGEQLAVLRASFQNLLGDLDYLLRRFLWSLIALKRVLDVGSREIRSTRPHRTHSYTPRLICTPSKHGIAGWQ